MKNVTIEGIEYTVRPLTLEDVTIMAKNIDLSDKENYNRELIFYLVSLGVNDPKINRQEFDSMSFPSLIKLAMTIHEYTMEENGEVITKLARKGLDSGPPAGWIV